MNEEVTISYKIKHKNLLKEEENLKEKLKNEVTKVKEKLEIYLTESNDKIHLSEKINKSIKNLKMKENMAKRLSYISKINETNNDMNTLFFTLMRNLEISFIENENSIKYEEYFFNGLPNPKGIEIKDITQNSANISWKIDKFKINNIDNKNRDILFYCPRTVLSANCPRKNSRYLPSFFPRTVCGQDSARTEKNRGS